MTEHLSVISTTFNQGMRRWNSLISTVKLRLASNLTRTRVIDSAADFCLSCRPKTAKCARSVHHESIRRTEGLLEQQESSVAHLEWRTCGERAIDRLFVTNLMKIVVPLCPGFDRASENLGAATCGNMASWGPAPAACLKEYYRCA